MKRAPASAAAGAESGSGRYRPPGCRRISSGKSISLKTGHSIKETTTDCRSYPAKMVAAHDCWIAANKPALCDAHHITEGESVLGSCLRQPNRGSIDVDRFNISVLARFCAGPCSMQRRKRLGSSTRSRNVCKPWLVPHARTGLFGGERDRARSQQERGG